MVVEIINTNDYELLDAGNYTFCVENVDRIEKNGKVSYKWTFSYVKNGSRMIWNKYLWSSQMGDILRFTGMPEPTSGKFALDYDLIKGKMFVCTIEHQEGKDHKVREAITNVNPIDSTVQTTATPVGDIVWNE